MREAYEPGIVHLLDEFERINRLISANIPYIKENIDQDKDKNKLDVQQQFGIPAWAVKKSEKLESIKQDIALRRNKINRKLENSNKEITNKLQFLKLQHLFNLTSEEVDIFLVCLIGEFDVSYQKISSYLQEDSNKIYFSVELILNLLSSSLEEKLSLKSYLHNNSTLFKYHLLESVETTSVFDEITFNSNVKVSPRILNYLLGQNVTHHFFASGILTFIVPDKSIGQLHLAKNIAKQIEVFTKTYQSLSYKDRSYVISIRGKPDSGQLLISEAICKAINANLLTINIDVLVLIPIKDLTSTLAVIEREAILTESAIYWHSINTLNSAEKVGYFNMIMQYISWSKSVHFFGLGLYSYFPSIKIKNCTFLEFEIQQPNRQERLMLWQAAFPEIDELELKKIAQNFSLGLGQINDIATHAKSMFRGNNTELTKSEIYKICHAHSHQYLSNFAKVIKPVYNIDDIVLQDDGKQELIDIINWIKYKDIVYEQGGFNKKISLGKGLIVLFFGPPGTGKTMASEIIGNSLNLLLCKVDLSAVLSKWVGETEQHLDKIFHDAEKTNAILFFDEADSLFGKRGEVHDARDNYANIQTSYLLQKVEEYPGIVILATNFKNNMDEAFTRRLHFSVEFHFPKPADRHKIWQQIWPNNIKPCDTINLQKLAEGIEIAGGHIRNIALAAAFKAAADQPPNIMPIIITKQQLLFATKCEFHKIGKIIMHEQLNKLFEI